eukprot:840698-Lingulodinium_polyedra.AAC.1
MEKATARAMSHFSSTAVQHLGQVLPSIVPRHGACVEAVTQLPRRLVGFLVLFLREADQEAIAAIQYVGLATLARACRCT